jgi:hypothetical protein
MSKTNSYSFELGFKTMNRRSDWRKLLIERGNLVAVRVVFLIAVDELKQSNYNILYFIIYFPENSAPLPEGALTTVWKPLLYSMSSCPITTLCSAELRLEDWKRCCTSYWKLKLCIAAYITMGSNNKTTDTFTNTHLKWLNFQFRFHTRKLVCIHG